jgi:hypothetical protein
VVLKRTGCRADPVGMSPLRTRPHRRLPEGDAGEIILGWFTKVVGLLAVLGVMAFDAISIGAATFQAEEQAQQAARRAAESYSTAKDIQVAYEAALAGAAAGDTIDPASFTVDPAGTVRLSLQRSTPTLLVEKIPPLREYATASRTVSVAPPR